MDFGRIDDSLKSPSPLGKCTTPPTGLTKIYNPFRHQHLHDSPYMSGFSPNAFATPNNVTDGSKFRWTIDDVSKLCPADIDENTDSHHVDVDDVDPAMEVLIQRKIDRYFSEKVIVPSPLTDLKRTSLIAIPEEREKGTLKETVMTSTQTTLSLPFDLPAHVQEALRPYFSNGDHPVTPVYRKTSDESVGTSPAISTGLSPIIFSPEGFDRFDGLSPIPRESLGRSVCRLDFSTGEMSVDMERKSPELATDRSLQPLNGSAANWDMEFEYVSFVSPPMSPDAMMELTQLSTPNSRLFANGGQRKRLSDSFRESNKENDAPVHVFASTPSRGGRY